MKLQSLLILIAIVLLAVILKSCWNKAEIHAQDCTLNGKSCDYDKMPDSEIEK